MTELLVESLFQSYSTHSPKRILMKPALSDSKWQFLQHSEQRNGWGVGEARDQFFGVLLGETKLSVCLLTRQVKECVCVCVCVYVCVCRGGEDVCMYVHVWGGGGGGGRSWKFGIIQINYCVCVIVCHACIKIWHSSTHPMCVFKPPAVLPDPT